MTRVSVRAQKAISRRIDDQLDGVENTVLENEIALADEGAGEELYHIAETAASSYHAMSATRDIDADETPVHDGMSDAHYAALDALTDYVEQLAAKSCAHVIQHADQWAAREDASYDPDTYERAKHEAREWLQQHVDAAKRAGVLDDLQLAGRPEGQR